MAYLTRRYRIVLAVPPHEAGNVIDALAYSAEASRTSVAGHPDGTLAILKVTDTAAAGYLEDLLAAEPLVSSYHVAAIVEGR